VAVTGVAAGSLVVRLRGATDMHGAAYEWAPYRWRRLTRVRGTWRGLLPAPALRGVYQLQLRVQGRRRLLQSPHWLLRVLPPGTLEQRAFATPRAAIRDFVAHLRGHQVLTKLRSWPQPAYDHRDPRLNRLFVVAYAPRGTTDPSARLGLFISTFRDGFDGEWRVLQAATEPPD
jgi:hypothetical protein